MVRIFRHIRIKPNLKIGSTQLTDNKRDGTHPIRSRDMYARVHASLNNLCFQIDRHTLIVTS